VTQSGFALNAKIGNKIMPTKTLAPVLPNTMAEVIFGTLENFRLSQ